MAAFDPELVQTMRDALGQAMTQVPTEYATVETKAYLAEHKPSGLVYGRGWIETGWPEGRFLNRQDIDAVAPDQPVILQRADGHAMTANSAALRAAHIDETTPAACWAYW